MQTENLIRLVNEQVIVALDAERPIIVTYKHMGMGEVLLGDYAKEGPEFWVCRGLQPFHGDRLSVDYSLIASDTHHCRYCAKITVDSEPAVSLELAFILEDDKLRIRYGEVVEQPGYYLIRAALRTLSITAVEDGARMILPCGLGRSMMLATASPGMMEMELGWKNAHLCTMLHTTRLLGMLECEAFEDRLRIDVTETPHGKYGSLSVIFVHRLHEYELAEYGHRYPASDPIYYLNVQQSSEAVITLLAAKGRESRVTWMDAARQIRAGVEASPLLYYGNKWITKMALDISPNSEKITFDEALDMIKRLHFLTNGQPMILYLVGWQHTGHDTGYPSVTVVNEGLGGEPALRRLMEEAQRYKVLVSFHDNYDDAYEDSDAWDEEVVSRDAAGGLMRCGLFNQRQAYLLNNLTYARKYGMDRARDTVHRYNIRQSYHIDVLSGAYKGGRRYDFNPSSPMNARGGLEGKRLIISTFNECGVDVTTEDFSSLLVGPIRHFWSMGLSNETFYPNEEPIPLIPYIYHSKASYGMGMTGQPGFLRGLLYGATFSMDITKDNISEQIEKFYLAVLPWIQLYGKEMASYESDGGVEKVVYEDGSYVAIDMANDSYEVSVQGYVIGHDYIAFVPVAEDTVQVYSKYGGTISRALPSNWLQSDPVVVSELCKNGAKREMKSHVSDGKLTFNADAGIPYLVSRYIVPCGEQG